MTYSNRKIFIAVIGIIAAIYAFKNREITHPAGVLIPENPIQVEIPEGGRKPYALNEKISASPLATYRIKARVLSTNRFWFDPGAAIAPIDLALGWGPMSDSSNLNEFSVSQSLRYYHIRWSDSPPIPENEIMRHSANVHIIPSNDLVKTTLLNLRKGHLIEMSGDLVVVSSSDRGEWRSSLSRDDTGNGACELMYVTSLRVLNSE